MATTHWATDGTLGVDLEHTSTTALHRLGSRTVGNNNSGWLYVYASAGITLGAVVAVEASGTASMITNTVGRGAVPYTLAIAQVAFTAADYGWVATSGSVLTVLTTGACTAGARLYTTDTAGRLSTTIATASTVQIGGLAHSVTTGTTASSAPCVAQNLVRIWPEAVVT